MLWEIDIYTRDAEHDQLARQAAREARLLGCEEPLTLRVARGYLLEGNLQAEQIEFAARELLADPVLDEAAIATCGDPKLDSHFEGFDTQVHVLPKPGVMDPVALTATASLAELGLEVVGLRTFKKYWIRGLDAGRLEWLCRKVLANDAIEQVVVGPLSLTSLELGRPYTFARVEVPLGQFDDEALARLSREGQLFLDLEEMRTIQRHFQELGRDPTDVELETLAQTWSEHCSHKTLTGPVRYLGPEGEYRYENLLKETIFQATQRIRENLGDDDWCVSVFKDNAGVVRFDDKYHAVFKVETHNHPSALEPYGGANTGLGGVIRDPLGTGLGAKPVCSTDVFCFGPPDTPPEELPSGVQHPRRVMQGVVAGVRDYGNRMGIPTVNGAVLFDRRYLGNPLVYCGNVGLLPVDRVEKNPQAGDYIVVVGGRTGRDGIHGATFSSAELTAESEELSGGAVQIGNAIAEKMLVDVILQARDEGLFSAITDCGAGGLSSAVGEMGADLGAQVELEQVPVKYEGLTYTEIWISEAQERMVLAVPPAHWERFHALCAAEGVEAAHIGEFMSTGRLCLQYEGQKVADLAMEFLHNGRPRIEREATYAPPEPTPARLPDKYTWDYTEELQKILGSLNVASKEAIIRQYDHEVQGGSVIKPLVGIQEDGPSDAAVVRPRLDSLRGLVVACGINPHFGDHDTYHMAASAIDEAVRNCVAVGADPARIAILDNFCWGDTSRPETLGSLVRAAEACRDVAIAWNTPFISGKDSLNNEYRYADPDNTPHVLAIPPTLLISALGQVEDVRRCVTMDLKENGNFIYQVGVTKNELGGSHYSLISGFAGSQVPVVDVETARATFESLHGAISSGLVRACHDLSEGGLAVAAAEMAFAGGLGARFFLAQAPHELELDEAAAEADAELRAEFPQLELHPLAAMPHAAAILLFSESNSRFLCEVAPDDCEEFERRMGNVPHGLVGEVVAEPLLQIVGIPAPQPHAEEGVYDPQTAPLVIEAPLAALKGAWQRPLRW